MRTRRRSRAHLRQQQTPYWLRRMKTRTFLLSALLVILYMLCWAPYNIVAILNIERSDDGPMHWVYYFHHLIGVNSALNPLIYGMAWRRRFSIRGHRLARLPTASYHFNRDETLDETPFGSYLTINGNSNENPSRSSTMGTMYDRTSIIEESSIIAKSPEQSIQTHPKPRY